MYWPALLLNTHRARAKNGKPAKTDGATDRCDGVRRSTGLTSASAPKPAAAKPEGVIISLIFLSSGRTLDLCGYYKHHPCLCQSQKRLHRTLPRWDPCSGKPETASPCSTTSAACHIQLHFRSISSSISSSLVTIPGLLPELLAPPRQPAPARPAPAPKCPTLAP